MNSDITLLSGTSQRIIDKNIARLMEDGKTRDEAKRIAYKFAGVSLKSSRNKRKRIEDAIIQ